MRAGISNNTLSKEHALNTYLRTLIVSIQYSMAEGLPWSPIYSKKKGFMICYLFGSQAFKQTTRFLFH